MSQFWFKPKKYGYGVYPATWQGWVALFCLCLLILVVMYVDLPIGEGIIPTLKEWLRYLLDLFILTALFLLIFKDKVEGGLKWRWGKD
jgi:hypothetical protein